MPFFYLLVLYTKVRVSCLQGISSLGIFDFGDTLIGIEVLKYPGMVMKSYIKNQILNLPSVLAVA